MLREIITKSDAAHEWVREFNAIDRGIIEKLMSIDIDDWQEVTMPCVGDRVYCFDSVTYGEIVDIDNNDYTISLDDGTEITLSISDFEVERYDLLPMWGTMWSFGDGLDDEWLSDYDGIKLMSECGFRIFYSGEFGYFFGIDGAGYDFYEAHWIPLYEARGLHWHEEKC